ncbi:hypothetical protein E3J74_01520 [Candidatus Bathyarchaeota archaeon]|nr:MAG: hypothetical protein E3J74_01520 [Candidatus Bathyarchaeota archaeon]
MAELKENVSSLSARMKNEEEIDIIQREIAFYKREQKDLERSLLWLSVKGAVYAPTAFFSVSLLACAFGILEVLNQEILLASSVVTIVIGALCLGKTLKSTEKAATAIPRPKYEVFFSSTRLRTKQYKANKRPTLNLVFHNIGDERSEKPLMVICFPEGIETRRKPKGWNKITTLYGVPAGEFEYGYSLVVDVINVDGYFSTGRFDLVAKRTGAYKILITIKDQSGRHTHEVSLNVV